MIGKLLSATVAAAAILAMTQGADAQPKKYVFALVPKNTEQPVLRPGARRLQEGREGAGRRDRVPLHRTRRAWRRRRAGAGRQRPDRQEGRRHRRIALERGGDGQGAGRRQGGRHPGPHLGQRPAARRTRPCALAYVGTHNYEIGVNLAKLAQKIKPKGGTICIQSGGAAAANHNERMQGIRDTLAGAKSAQSPGDRLTGQNGWTEVDGCPLYTNDDFPLSVQQMEDILGKYPEARRLHPDRRLPAVHPAGLPEGRREVQGAHRRRRRWPWSSPTRCRCRSSC